MQALSVGAKVWGAVTEISSKELIISLPHGLRAHVAAADVRHGSALIDAVHSALSFLLYFTHNCGYI